MYIKVKKKVYKIKGGTIGNNNNLLFQCGFVTYSIPLKSVHKTYLGALFHKGLKMTEQDLKGVLFNVND